MPRKAEPASAGPLGAADAQASPDAAADDCRDGADGQLRVLYSLQRRSRHGDFCVRFVARAWRAGLKIRYDAISATFGTGNLGGRFVNSLNQTLPWPPGTARLGSLPTTGKAKIWPLSDLPA